MPDLVEYLILYFVALLATKLFLIYAHRLRLLDIPNERSSHKEPVARGAGIIFSTLFLAWLCLKQDFFCTQHWLTVGAFVSVIIVGLYDDIVSLKALKKLFFLALASLCAYVDGFQITTLGNYFGFEMTLGFLALPFTVFAITGFTNAVNLIDGIDGLAGSVSFCIISVLAYIGYMNNDYFLMSSGITLLVLIAAFLVFNRHPAIVFMGDTGSLFLGFVIALLSIHALRYINVTSVLFIAGIPILDTLVVFARRLQRNISPFRPDKNHLHHILLNFKGDVRFTVYLLVLIQLCFSLIALQVSHSADLYNVILFVVLYLIFFGIFDPRVKWRNEQARVLEPAVRERVASKRIPANDPLPSKTPDHDRHDKP